MNSDKFQVNAQVELMTGPTRIVNGKVDLGKSLEGGSLGVYIYDARNQRGRLHASYGLTLIPWPQVKMLHVDH